ncbi:MAG: membrane-bound lytic murein transglycosylase MltF [Marinicella sp.]
MHKLRNKKTAILLLSVFLLSPFTFYDRWDFISLKGTIKYGTRTSLLSYFKVEKEVVGYEYKLLHDFAKVHNLNLETIVYQNNGELLSDLNLGKIDIAGGHLSITKARTRSFAFSIPISQTAIDLITHFDYRNLDELKNFESLKGTLISNSSYEELLQDLSDFSPEFVESTNESLFELFRKVTKKEIDFTFADTEIANIYKNFIPGIYQPMQLSPKEEIAFMVSKNRTQNLLAELNQFIKFTIETGQIKAYKAEILEHLPQINEADTVTFFDKLQTRWPEVKHYVLTVAKNLDFDPALLAAISYQESHWNTDAISITGVKGLMMLTESTAEEMNVSDRTDAVESLIGGIKYYRKMKAKMPDRIDEPDRTLFALAAYNVGYGHLEDARILAQRAGKNPDIWLDVEPYLEQLNNPTIAHELKYGVADGQTAVIYVNNIMTFKQLMTWKMQKENIMKYDRTYL